MFGLGDTGDMEYLRRGEEVKKLHQKPRASRTLNVVVVYHVTIVAGVNMGGKLNTN